MAFTINPPRSALVNSQGLVTQEWYRFFAAIQRVVGTDIVGEMQGAPYITFTTSAALGNERVLTAGEGVAVDVGSSTVVVSVSETGVAAGGYGGASSIAAFTVDETGRITSATNVPLVTTNVAEGTQLYFTQARARQSLGAGTGISYDAGTGVIAVNDNYIASGSYTPTVAGQTNVTSVQVSECQWLRIGDRVEVGGHVTVQPTAANAITAVRISLPIPSNFTAVQDVAGAGAVTDDLSEQAAAFYASTSLDQAVMQWRTVSTTSRNYSFTFIYRVRP